MTCPRTAFLYPYWQSVQQCEVCGAKPTEKCQMSDRGVQVGGDHYSSLSVQPLDVMKAVMSADEMRGFLWGNAIKYAMRWQKKGGVEDLRKLRHYTDLLIEHEVEG